MPYATGDLLEFITYCRARNQNGLNVYHYTVGTTHGTVPNEGSVVGLLSSVFGPLLRTAMSNEAEYSGASIQTLQPEPMSDKVYSTASAGVGGVSSTLLPSRSAGVISLRTGVASRSARGRKYIPFPAEADNNTDAKPSAAYLDALAALADEIVNIQIVGEPGLNDVQLIPVIYSRELDAATALTQALVRKEWGTQRRRSQINRGDAPPIP